MANRVFSLLHLSLVEVTQPSLNVFRGSREDWLRRVLNSSFDFSGWGGRQLVWTPRGSYDDLIFGVIQGKKSHIFHEPPSRGGAETEDDFWQGAYVFLDPRHHDDGQKLAIENDVLGRPRTLAKSLFDYINAREDAPFTCIAEPMFDEQDFWKFSRESGGVLKYIKFEFVVPNMWGPQNDLEKDLKDTGKETGSDQVEVVLKSKDGVRTENDKVRSGVAYVSKGAGVVKAKNLEGKPYSSDQRPTKARVPREDLEDPSGASVGDVGRRLLGRG
jgi:hypothetical protein